MQVHPFLYVSDSEAVSRLHLHYRNRKISHGTCRLPDYKVHLSTVLQGMTLSSLLLLLLLLSSHFHLDHCGALPYFTEMCGYDGPIYMTHPTKAICPILLVRDEAKVGVSKGVGGG